MKIVIKSIFINSDYKGTPFINKNGEPYKRASLTTVNGGKASMYIGQKDINKLAVVSSWKAGDEVEVEIEKVGEYTNFNLPKNATSLKESVEAGRMDVLNAGNTPTPSQPPKTAPEMTVAQLEYSFRPVGEQLYGKDPDEVTPDPIDPELIPF